MYILEIENLFKTFKSDLFKENVEAVRGISCKFIEGTTTAIIGHNGAGKTTTIRMILGLIKADRGKIKFRESNLSDNDRIDIGYMPEISRLTETLTPFETLDIHLKFYRKLTRKDHKATIASALSKVGLEKHQTKLVKQLSKGLKRRLAFAMATIHHPKLLILDEPFAGLDPLAHGHMEKWINEEKMRGASIIMSSHQVAAIARICDHFHVLLDGTLSYSSVEDGTHKGVGSGFGIELSGIDKKSLSELFQKHSLPEPVAWTNTTYQHSISFASYEASSLCLKHLLNEGVVISNFSENSSITEAFILSLLQKGEQNG